MLSPLLLLALACTDGDLPPADSADAADADTDTDSDTDADSDADSDSDSDSDSDADADPVRGETLYLGTCAGGYCHGGDTIHEERVPEMTDDEIRTVIVNGYNYMPAQDLTAGQIDDVIAYMRLEYGGG